MSADYYAILGLANDASPESVREAYERKISGADAVSAESQEREAELKKLHAAYAVLSDETRRFAYDINGYDAEFADIGLSPTHVDAVSESRPYPSDWLSEEESPRSLNYAILAVKFAAVWAAVIYYGWQFVLVVGRFDLPALFHFSVWFAIFYAQTALVRYISGNPDQGRSVWEKTLKVLLVCLPLFVLFNITSTFCYFQGSVQLWGLALLVIIPSFSLPSPAETMAGSDILVKVSALMFYLHCRILFFDPGDARGIWKRIVQFCGLDFNPGDLSGMAAPEKSSFTLRHCRRPALLILSGVFLFAVFDLVYYTLLDNPNMRKLESLSIETYNDGYDKIRYLNRSYRFSVFGNFSDGKIKRLDESIFGTKISSSNPSVAYISDGSIYTVSAGTTIITATNRGRSVSLNFDVHSGYDDYRLHRDNPRKRRFVGTPADDIIRGSQGSNTLEGGDGNDTYLWEIGDGNDTIVDHSGDIVVRFGKGIDPAAIRISRFGDDLRILASRNPNRGITIQSWLANQTWRSMNSYIEFEYDGTRWYSVDISMILAGRKKPFRRPPMTEDASLTAEGKNAFVWKTGIWNQTIEDPPPYDVIKIEEGADPTTFRLAIDRSDLVIRPNGLISGKLTLKNFCRYESMLKWENIYIVFTDGTKWNYYDMFAIARGLKKPFSRFSN
ncbi:MAG: DnaJ domain-containing protein [Synergistaceae bacterium]|jgi:hypothetical protein|nr:DnaJ domain-containing protein [Synergistaceae bacterium]